MRQGHSRVAWAMVVIALLVVSACSEPAGDSEPAGSTGAVPDTTYLEEVIPPCIPLEGSSIEPCATGVPRQVAMLSAPATPPLWPIRDDLLTVTEVIMGYDPATITHVVVRATVLENSTRCGLYPLVLPDFTGVLTTSGGYRYNCYVDLRVNEYLVGTGPAVLTVELHREMLIPTEEQIADWDNWKDGWLRDVVRDPQRRTAAVFEGKELVLFLGPSFTMAVQSWEEGGGFGTVWFVQQPEEGAVRAVASDIVHALTEDQRNKLDMALADLVTLITAGATARDDAYDGRIGEDSDLPDLVTDANMLQAFYIEVGAVYEGEDATTVMPPPLELPGKPRNLEVSSTGLVTWDPPTSGGPVHYYHIWLGLGDGNVLTFTTTETRLDISDQVDVAGGKGFSVTVWARNTAGRDWADIVVNPAPASTTTTALAAPGLPAP